MLEQKIHILIVEDNVYIVQLLEGMLAADPSLFTISSAETIAKGIKCLHAEEIDLILLDLNLPDSSGLDTLENIQVSNPVVPIVILSGMDDNEIAIQAVERGAQDYLVKGRINCDLLYSSIHQALKQFRQERM